jgi:hypothetical protein
VPLRGGKVKVKDKGKGKGILSHIKIDKRFSDEESLQSTLEERRKKSS